MRSLSITKAPRVNPVWGRAALRSSLPVALALMFVSFGQPAPASDSNDLSQQVQALQTQITTLQQQDQQVQAELAQIQQQVAAKQPPPPSQPGTIPGLPAVEAPIVITIDVTGRPMQGNSAAKATIIEFTDFECPDSGLYARTIYPQVVANYVKTGKLRYYYVDCPQPVYPHARPAAAAAHCAADQGKFWEMYGSLFADQSSLDESDFSDRAKSLGLNVKKFNACLDSDKYDSTVRDGITECKRVGIQQAPTFYFGTLRGDGSGIVDIDKKVIGNMSYAVFQHEIDSEVAKK